MNENQPLNQPKRPTLHPPDGDPKAKQITLWIVVGIIAIVAVYFLLYSNIFKKEDTPESQVVIPEQTVPQPDTFSQAPIETSDILEEVPPSQIEQQPETKKVEQKKETVTQPKQNGSFTIYVGTFINRLLAEKEKEKFIEKEYDAFLVPKGTMVRVAIGKFSSRAEAKKVADEIKSKLKKDCWVDKIE